LKFAVVDGFSRGQPPENPFASRQTALDIEVQSMSSILQGNSAHDRGTVTK
jgi:hypothetical protein